LQTDLPNQIGYPRERAKRILEMANVSFVDENGGESGVRLRKRQRKPADKNLINGRLSL
jgi:hypothetical protein